MSTSSDQSPRSSGSHYQPSMPVVILLLLAFIISAFVIERATHSSSTPSTAPTSSPTTTPGKKHHGGTTKPTTTTTPIQKRVPKSQVSVQVANGTNTRGLARTFTVNLQIQGWNTLSPLNSPPVRATIVYYAPRFQWAATEIATAIKVPVSAARPLGAARPVPGAAGDDIVVILGLNAHP